MKRNALDPIISAFREGAPDLGSRAKETVTQVADSVGRILDEAGTEGAKIKKALVSNWTSLGRPRRSRAVPVLFGVLALAAASVYLLGRTGTPLPRG